MRQPQNSPLPGKNSKDAPRVFFRRAEVLAIYAALLCAAVWLALMPIGPAGGLATVKIAYREVSHSFEVPLSYDRTVNVNGALPVTLTVKDGAICFAHSLCPDHLCEGFGWLRHLGDWAFCAPAGVTVRID